MTDFKINGTTYEYLINIDWRDASSLDVLDGTSVRNRWRQLTARASEAMPEDEFDTLFALQGQAVNVTCSPYGNPAGDYVTYYQARLLSVDSRHTGPLHAGVVAEFEVLV